MLRSNCEIHFILNNNNNMEDYSRIHSSSSLDPDLPCWDRFQPSKD